MKCSSCDNDMLIMGSKAESDIGSTAVYRVFDMQCLNPKCTNYRKSTTEKRPENDAALKEVGAVEAT